MNVPFSALVGLLVIWSVAVLVLYGFLVIMRHRRVKKLRVAQESADRVRPQVAQYLVGDAPATDLLEGQAQDDVAAMRATAIRMLPQLRGQDADRLVGFVEQASLLLDHPGEHDAIATGGGASEADMVDTLTDSDPDVRILAGYALAAGDHVNSASVILAAVAGERPIPGAMAADILQRMCPGALEQIRAGLSEEPVSEEPVSKEPLGKEPVREGSVLLRMVAITVLGHVRDRESLPELIALAENEAEPPEVRLRAAHALGRIGSLEAIPALRTCLVGSPELVAVAAQARAEIAGPGVLEDLVPLLDSPDHAVAHAAAAGIGSLEHAGPDALRAVPGPGQARAFADWGLWEATRPPSPRADVLPLPGFTAMASLAEFAEPPEAADGDGTYQDQQTQRSDPHEL